MKNNTLICVLKEVIVPKLMAKTLYCILPQILSKRRFLNAHIFSLRFLSSLKSLMLKPGSCLPSNNYVVNNFVGVAEWVPIRR